MKQSLKALRLGAGGRPDELSARLLNHISKAVPNLVLGAMQEITTYESKPPEMSKIFLICINMSNLNKRFHKWPRQITIISNLLKKN